MTIGEIRLTLWSMTLSNARDNTESDCDRAFRAAAERLIFEVPQVIQTTTTKVMTAFVSEVSVSASTSLRPENIRWASLGLVDQGTWAVGTAYSVYDVVVGDGAPDAYLYRCDVANTGNQPPNSTYWTQVYTKQGPHLLGPVDVDEIVYNHANRGSFAEPTTFAFTDQDTVLVFPTPDLAYPFTHNYWGPLATWTIGQKDGTTAMNIDDQFMDGILMGAAAVLDAPKPDALDSAPGWRRFVSEFIPATKSRVASPVQQKTFPESAYISEFPT